MFACDCDHACDCDVIVVRRVKLARTMIFVHLIDDNFGDNLTFLSFYWSKTIEREKEDHVSMREKIVQKLSHNGCTNMQLR